MENFPITKRLLDHVKNARVAYESFLEVEKTEAKRTADSRSAREKTSQQENQLVTDLMAVEEELESERGRFLAANNIILNGREKLDEALAEKTLKKENVVKAKSIIDIGSEKAEQLKMKIHELEIKRNTLHDMEIKRRALLKRKEAST